MARLSIILSPALVSPDEIKHRLACLETSIACSMAEEDIEVLFPILAESPNEWETACFHGLKTRVFQVTGSDWSAAWYAGLQAASGEICLFLSGDLEPDSELISAHLASHRESNFAISQVGYRFAGKTINRGEPPNYTPALSSYSALVFSLRRDLALDLARSCSDQAAAWLESLITLAHKHAPNLWKTGAYAFEDLDQHFQKHVKKAFKHGQIEANLIKKMPTAASNLKLGQFNDLGMRGMLLRRFGLRLPTSWVAWASRQAAEYGMSEEWHWFLFTLAYWQGVKHGLQNETILAQLINSPVILMYHAVGNPAEKAGEYLVPLPAFRRQMDLLKWFGWQVVPIEQIFSDRKAGLLPRARSVAITFDDGYRDNVEIALPVLRKHGFPAEIFVVCGAIGGTNNWADKDGLGDRPLLKRNELQSIFQHGFRIGGHGMSHQPLSHLSGKALQAELSGTYTTLADLLQTKMIVFAYPHGRYNSEVAEAVKQAGFAGACCSDHGPCEPRAHDYALPRLEIRGDSSLLDFALALWLGKTNVLRRLLESK
jgi:peptidoglycan/xylan/chitin deacetylase (PgdA/CDA1 family)